MRGYPLRVVFAVFAVLIVIFVILPLVAVSVLFVVRALIVGVILGALGRLIVPGSQPIGALATVCCGWIGSLVGGGIAAALHLHWLGSTLVTIGVAAAAVAVWSVAHHGSVTGRPRRTMVGR